MTPELTVSGKPRKRKVGAGRPSKHGEATRSIRVPLSLSTDQITSLPELKALIDHWEDEMIAAKERGESMRTYEKLAKFIDEARALGY